MDRLELRRVTCYPSVNGGDVVILVGNFGIPAGLRAAEASLSSQQVCVLVFLMTWIFRVYGRSRLISKGRCSPRIDFLSGYLNEA